MADNKIERRTQILNRLISAAKQCQSYYNGRKELATEKDENVLELCESLEEAFSYGLKANTTSSSVPISILQNVQDIVAGLNSSNEVSFWGFCQKHLTPHEKQRFENLSNIWTKWGKTKAFIRSALNEKSLERYVLMWLDDNSLPNYYETWSLMLHSESANRLPSIIADLNSILFALTVDTPDINVSSTSSKIPVRKDEPLIYAPTPVAPTKKISAVKRPIACSPEPNESDMFPPKAPIAKPIPVPVVHAKPIEVVVEDTPREHPVFPVLSDFANEDPSEILTKITESETQSGVSLLSQELDNKSECSSEYSKTSSTQSVKQESEETQTVLEEKLREMSERCALLETRVAKLSLENRQLRRLTNYTDKGPGSANCLITIPHVKLVKNRPKRHYLYEINITMVHNLEKWTIFRRYREFYKLNEALKLMNSSVASIEFPPKKRFGNMNILFVEERRQLLQIYLRNLLEILPELEACKTKDDMQTAFPFFREL